MASKPDDTYNPFADPADVKKNVDTQYHIQPHLNVSQRSGLDQVITKTSEVTKATGKSLTPEKKTFKVEDNIRIEGNSTTARLKTDEANSPFGDPTDKKKSLSSEVIKGPDALSNKLTASVDIEKIIEAAVEQQTTAADDSTPKISTIQQSVSVKNFPPLCGFCPCTPCLRHSIVDDIPSHLHLYFRLAFICWVCNAVVWFLNICASAAFLSADSDATATFGVSWLLFLICVPWAFGWYWLLYSAFRDDSKFKYWIFAAAIVIQTGLTIAALIGITDFTSGYVNGIKTVGKHAAGGFMIVTAVLFTVVAIANVGLLVKAHFYKVRNSLGYTNELERY